MEYMLRTLGTRAMGEDPQRRDLEKQRGQCGEGPSPKETLSGLEHPRDGGRITVLEDNTCLGY